MAFMGGNTAEWHKLVDGLSFADDATDANAFSGHFGLADMARAADAIDRVPAPPDPALADPIREAASAAWPKGGFHVLDAPSSVPVKHGCLKKP